MNKKALCISILIYGVAVYMQSEQLGILGATFFLIFVPRYETL